MQPQRHEEEKDDSLLKRYAEMQAKKHSKKLARKLVGKGAKLALKLAKLAVKKLAMLLAKGVAWLIGTIGLPVILIAIFSIIAIVAMSLAFSFFFGTGEGLTGVDRQTYEYIVEQSHNTVNMDSAVERPYRVPEKLIAATIQLEFFKEHDDLKEIIRTMAKKLAPTFDYGEYDEWNEKQVTVCEDGTCNNGEVVRTKKMVTKLDHVDYWNGSTTFTYTPKITDWETVTVTNYKTIEYANLEEVCIDVLKYNPAPYLEKQCSMQMVKHEREIEIKTTTKTRKKYYESSKVVNTDYSTLDGILNSYGLGFDDKRLLEANYLFLGGQIAYTDWLLTMGGGDLGFISFDGTIIPGGGVPPQFMPYYLAAEKKYGVHWYIIAAIHFVETGFSTHPTMISSVGAVGHVQFMPATWVGWSYDIGGGLVSPGIDITSLAVIASGNGYGRDGNGDGKADPWNVEDAIHTAAYYLSKNGYSTDPRNAIWHYNHAEWYVNKVLTNAEKFKNAATYEGGGEIPPLQPGSFMRPATGAVTSPFGYRDGDTHFGIDIGAGGRSNVPIVAAADGVVTRSAFSTSYGNVVYIKHNIGGKEFETVYAHMQNRTVALGATVKQGQFLGYMGNTGKSFGPHLHFEVHNPSWQSNKANALNPALVVPF